MIEVAHRLGSWDPGWLGAASLPAGLPAGYGWLAPPAAAPQTTGGVPATGDAATPYWE